MAVAEPSSLIGVDVGGTHVRVGVVRGHQVVWERRDAARLSRRSPADDPERALQTVVGSLREILAEALERYPEAAGIGLAIAGFVDPETGRLASSPNIPGLRDADLVAPLAQALGLPVVVENDALAAAMGEFALHPGRPDSLLYLGLGTGVGGGVILNGQAYRGRHGAAMEIGHLILEPGGRPCGCGNRGCLERYASASGVVLSYQASGAALGDAGEIAARADQGDAAARDAFEQAGEALAVAAAHLFKVLDVPDLVIGGGLIGGWRLMEAAFNRRLEHDLIPLLRGRVRVTLSSAGDQAGMIGAALLAR